MVGGAKFLEANPINDPITGRDGGVYFLTWSKHFAEVFQKLEWKLIPVHSGINCIFVTYFEILRRRCQDFG